MSPVGSTGALARPAATQDAPAGGVAFVGNPNAGKTTLFNALTGLRAKTSNFPGTTCEHRVGRMNRGSDLRLIDLPGLYSLNRATAEERVARSVLEGRLPGAPATRAIVLLLDATNLERNLYLASQVLELRRPTVVALNMIDLAERAGISIDPDRLSAELGCPVVPTSARTGRGVEELAREIERAARSGEPQPTPAVSEKLCNCSGCPYAARYDWAASVGRRCMSGSPVSHGAQTERIDRLLTHPVGGTAAFLGVMFAVFALIFWVARFPMGWIETLFSSIGAAAAAVLPAGDVRSLVVDGIIGGVGGVLVFLPQILILFFFLSLLEDTGYLARAAFVMDRLMRRVGLPGKAFVPMLSAHACAVPAIMSARVIENRRDRLVTVLVLPLLTCSARIPVYAIVIGLLFSDRPLLASGLFTAAYLLGVVAALGMAFVFKRTLLPGETRPLVLELPDYKVPCLRTAILTTLDRARIFVRKAGTIILLLSVALWALAHFPRSEPPAEARALERQAIEMAAAGRTEEAVALDGSARRLTARLRLENSAAGRIGRFLEPALEPLGFDWQIGVGVLSSFAAREVIVSTMAIVYGAGERAVGEDPESLREMLRSARDSEGRPVFTVATCISLLVFYVLAMQCLPTQVIARRETGGWRWPLFQLAYMSVLAYVGAFVAYQTLAWLGMG